MRAQGEMSPTPAGRVGAGLSLPDGVCEVYALGRLPYQLAWDLQRTLVARRKRKESADSLLLLEHSPAITLGRNADREHLRSSAATLEQQGIDLVETDRGGDVTFHGPGQLVGYPILDLSLIRKDVVWYVRMLEEVLIRAAQDFGLPAARKPGLTGVWVNQAKVAAIGIHISRWVTSHGFALNLETDLRFYRHIVPCGISAYPVTSFRELLGRPVSRSWAEQRIVFHMAAVFGLQMRWAPPESLERRESCPPMC